MVYQTILDRAGNIDTGREPYLVLGPFFGTRAVVVTDIAIHSCAFVTDAIRLHGISVIANQDKASSVVVTVIIADCGVLAIVIGVISLSIPSGRLPGGLVELDYGIVRRPGPDSGRSVVVLAPGICAVADDIVFHKSTVAFADHYAIARNPFNQILPDDNMFVWIPCVP